MNARFLDGELIGIKHVDVPKLILYLQKEKYTYTRIGVAVGRTKRTVCRWANYYNKPQNIDAMEALVKFAMPRLTADQMERCGVQCG